MVLLIRGGDSGNWVRAKVAVLACNHCSSCHCGVGSCAGIFLSWYVDEVENSVSKGISIQLAQLSSQAEPVQQWVMLLVLLDAEAGRL